MVTLKIVFFTEIYFSIQIYIFLLAFYSIISFPASK